MTEDGSRLRGSVSQAGERVGLDVMERRCHPIQSRENYISEPRSANAGCGGPWSHTDPHVAT